MLITDIHGDVDQLEKIMNRAEYDHVLCAGDLSDANEYEDYTGRLQEVLDTMDREGIMVHAVPGNMDPEEECVSMLRDFRMNLHRNIASVNGNEAVGFGGGQTPFGTPYEPEGKEIKQVVETLYDRMSSDTKIAVIHQPPKNTGLDLVDGDHVGSPEVREMIEDKEFDLFLTGHIHEASGKQEIDGTLAVNPGPVMEGRYGVATVEQGEIEVELKQI